MLPTNTEKKEELIEKFNEFIRNDDNDTSWSAIFNFFYSEMEQREKKLEAKLKAQEEILKAADEVIECVEINTETHFFSINWKIKEALEKYTTLKQQE